LSQNYYRNGDEHYDVSTLIQYAKEREFPVFNLALAGVDLEAMPYKIEDISGLIGHVYRINKANLSYPILLSEHGYIMDGWHRICKAILNGNTHIKAIRFTSLPNPAREPENK
jgi:hypothetical protein